MMITFDFSDRHAVVTGAGGGMGEAISAALLDAGASVTCFDLKPQPESLAAHGDRCLFLQMDITNGDQVASAVDAAVERCGPVNYLANVAGVLWFGRDASLFDMDLETWDQVFNINLKSMVHMIRSVTPHMRAAESGRAMVHFSTTQWYRGDPAPQDAYQASKAGVCALSKSVAMQLSAEGIRSNAICPGGTLSPLQARWDTEEKRAAAAAGIPLGRLGTPEDMANACLFLFSDAASYITGIELFVDGGVLMK
ncbi:MAG: SDR family NAD(P)-dependent oxidoreductase [Pseudomonadota bacterium]